MKNDEGFSRATSPAHGMRFSLSILGAEVLCIETGSTDEAEVEYDGSGTTGAYPVGFTRSEPAPFEYDVPAHVEEC